MSENREPIDTVELGAAVALEPVFFDRTRYPSLLKVIHSERYGRMELVSVHETSDGFLMGNALIGEGDDQYMHEVFLGSAADFKRKG